MQTENGPAAESSPAFYLQLLVGMALVFLVGAAGFAYLVLQKLDRVVAVVENVNAKVDHAVEAAAPLGRAAVDKGKKAIDAMDTEDMSKSATEGVKEIGRAAKDRAIKWINKVPQDSPENKE